MVNYYSELYKLSWAESMNKFGMVDNKKKIVAESAQFSETEKRVDTIKKELHLFLNKSGPFDLHSSSLKDISCSGLMDIAYRLTKLIPDVSLYEKETLLELLFAAIKKMVYVSKNLKIVEDSRNALIGLITCVVGLGSLLFSALQLKEIGDMKIMVMSCITSSTNKKDVDMHESDVVEVVVPPSQKKKFARSRKHMNRNKLPSPTRSQEDDNNDAHESDVVEVVVPPCQKNVDMHESDVVRVVVPPCQKNVYMHESDVVEVVVPPCRKKKFVRSRKHMNRNKLPSLTRSQEDDNNDAARVTFPSSTSRDPRYDKLLNNCGGVLNKTRGSTINLGKRKTVAELVLDGPELKRQRDNPIRELEKVCLNTTEVCSKPQDPPRNLYENTIKVGSTTIPNQPKVNITCPRKSSTLSTKKPHISTKESTKRLEEKKKLFGDRKLSLVLDLDHTLLNSVRFQEVDRLHDEILRKKEEQERRNSDRHLFRLPQMAMWTKLRPGIWKFLKNASKLFELHISTMGNKQYATAIAKLLDPKGELFSGRVISRGDDEKQPLNDNCVHMTKNDNGFRKTKDMEGILGTDSSVVIIDDTVAVWPHHKLNLVNVEPYIYFPSTRRQRGLSGPSLLEVDRDESREYGTLASVMALIENVHKSFFANELLDEIDVRDILATEQKKILAGCRILFSRIIPIGEANPNKHPLWQTAEQFGAVCTNQIDGQVTHVVATSLGTEKINWALSNGRFVVHPLWLEASAFLRRRANEQDFVIKQQNQTQHITI